MPYDALPLIAEKPYEAVHQHGVPFPTEGQYLNFLEGMRNAVVSNGAHSQARIEGLALLVDVNLGQEYHPKTNLGEAVVSVNPWNVRVRLTKEVTWELEREGYGTFFKNGNCDNTAELGRVLSIVDRELERVRTALQPSPAVAAAPVQPAQSQKYRGLRGAMDTVGRALGMGRA